MQAGYDGKGNREAYYIAAESAINEARHSIIEGQAVPGATLRLTKAFQTETYPQGDGDAAEPILFDDRLETTYDVPESGAFRWHINPSSRPIVAKDHGPRGHRRAEPAADDRARRETVPCSPVLVCAVGNDDQTFTVPEGPGIDNEIVRIRIEWGTQASDYDLKIYRPGASPTDQSPIVQSQQRGTDFEEVAILRPDGEYLIRVANVNAAEPWEGTITYEGPEPFQEGKTETWTLTCEVGGQVLSTNEVLISRGEVKQPDLGACDRRPPAQPGDGPGQGPGAGTPPPPVAGPAATCVPARGFRSVSARGRARRVRLGFVRAVQRPVTVDVFKQTRGRRVLGEVLVARYTNRARSFTWDGRANRPGRKVTNGYYLVRYRMQLASGVVDVRRVVMRRKRGVFTRGPRPTAATRAGPCGRSRSSGRSSAERRTARCGRPTASARTPRSGSSSGAARGCSPARRPVSGARARRTG